MRLSYRQRLFVYFSLIFLAFTLGIILYERVQEKKVKTQALEERLEAYTDMLYAALSSNAGEQREFKHIIEVLPRDLRITVIQDQGKVVFDNSISDFSEMDNHSARKEIQDAATQHKGSDIRKSDSNQQKYLYYAKNYGSIYIRAALPYTLQLKQVLAPGNASLYFILLFFLVFLFFIHVITNRFGKSVKQLRDFVVKTDAHSFVQPHFPKDELGEIGQKIAENFNQLHQSRENVFSERQKLLQHIQVLEEGVCFLSASRTVEFYNGLFVQYLNILTDEPSSDVQAVFKAESFEGLQQFLKNKDGNYYESTVQKQGKIFSIQANIFEDKSAEIILSDITKVEKNRQLKQEMTGNISHELRTPLTGIRGYLETVLSQELQEEQKEYFLKKAYQQTLTLSEMVQDMALIAKIEEAPAAFGSEQVDLPILLQRIKEESFESLNAKRADMSWQLPDDLKIKGNQHLLYSLFKNLNENALRYAGENIRIHIKLYAEDKEFYYFSFYDTGKGIGEEKHLNRLFERFYRVHEGRTRDSGGSGLGLSIVKNAVHLHKGTISAKNRKGGGLEFLFTLKK